MDKVGCPAHVEGLLKRLAETWDEKFIGTDDGGPDGPAVTVDGYEAVGWSTPGGCIVYTPSCDPGGSLQGDFEPEERFIISVEDLRRMVEEGDHIPQLNRAWAGSPGRD